jgi:hypothetical protein
LTSYLALTQNPNLLDCVLKNSDGSTAYDANCVFHPDLPYYENYTLSSMSIFKNLPFLQNGQEIRFLYRDLIAITGEGRAHGPKQTSVTIHYIDSEKNPYKENYLIDLERFKGIMFVDHRTMNDLVKEIVFLRKQLERMQTQGLSTETLVDLKKENEAAERSLYSMRKGTGKGKQR